MDSGGGDDSVSSPTTRSGLVVLRGDFNESFADSHNDDAALKSTGGNVVCGRPREGTGGLPLLAGGGFDADQSEGRKTNTGNPATPVPGVKTRHQSAGRNRNTGDASTPVPGVKTLFETERRNRKRGDAATPVTGVKAKGGVFVDSGGHAAARGYATPAADATTPVGVAILREADESEGAPSEDEKEACFVGRCPGTVHLRPLGPVRRSDEGGQSSSLRWVIATAVLLSRARKRHKIHVF